MDDCGWEVEVAFWCLMGRQSHTQVASVNLPLRFLQAYLEAQDLETLIQPQFWKDSRGTWTEAIVGHARLVQNSWDLEIWRVLLHKAGVFVDSFSASHLQNFAMRLKKEREQRQHVSALLAVQWEWPTAASDVLIFEWRSEQQNRG